MKSLLQSVALLFAHREPVLTQTLTLLPIWEFKRLLRLGKSFDTFLIHCAFLSVFLSAAHAQLVPAPQLVTARVDDARLTILKGNVHPLARPEFDRGRAPADLPMDRMLLLLKRSPAQQAALENLLAQQLDPASGNFHRWLSPLEFGSEFGLSSEDVDQVKSWLASHGFRVLRVSSGRTVIEFSGTAGQVSEAFHAAIHEYAIDSEVHWANSEDPSIPSALAPAVAGVVSLNDFPPDLPLHISTASAKRAARGELQGAAPDFTFASGRCEPISNECYGLSPADLATIYDISPLWASGIDGTGQALAISAASNVNIQDMRNFRSLFGLPAHDPVIVLNGPDPGLVESDKLPLEAEAAIDLQWAGAVAPNATLYLVVSKTTNSTFGMDLSAEYIVDNNLAPILSASYAGCEKDLGTSGNRFYNQLWQQAAAEGITVLLATGDSGSAGCEDFRASVPAPATSGLQVSGRGSTPYNTAVGGTDLNDAGNWAAYWNAANDPVTQASVKGYVPEMVWNDSCTNAVFGAHADPESNCNDPALTNLVGVFAGSGGVSSIYTKPAWQAAPGVPSDGMRDLPDVSLFAAGGAASATFYVLCEADIDADNSGAPCDLKPPFQHFAQAGGTSVSVQVFAGMMALVNQKSNSRQGNVGPVLYALDREQAGLFCDSSSPGPGCVFNDITVGTNAVPCKPNTRDCNVKVAGHTYGVVNGYNAGPGYDLATGLGSVNTANFVNASGWAANPAPDFALSSANAAVTVPAAGGSGSLALTITAVNGFSGTFDLSSASCSNLPVGTACSFSPSSVSVGAKSPTATVTVTITNSASATTKPPAGLPRPVSREGFAACLLLCMGLPIAGARRARGRLWRSGAILLVLLLALVGCGGGAGSGRKTNPGKTNPVITVRSGTSSHSIVFALTLE